MNFDQLAGLIKAGFNEEQIRNIGAVMDTGTGTGTNTPTETNTGTPTGTNTPTPTPTGAAPSVPPSVTPAAPVTPSTPAASPLGSGDTGTNAQSTGGNGGTLASAAQSAGNAESETVSLLKEMMGLIRTGNINTLGGGALVQPTGADVLAEILNPTPKTK